MSHEIENRNGIDSVAVVGKPAWHKLGQVAPMGWEGTVDEFIKLANMNTTAEKRLQIFPKTANAIVRDLDGNISAISSNPSDWGISDEYAIVRNEDNKQLGCGGERYEIFQNLERFQWFQPFLDSKECFLESAGSLKGGRVVWVQAGIRGDNLQVIPGDDIQQRLLLAGSFDGSIQEGISITPIRTVCWNTLRSARGSARATIRFKHTKNLRTNLENVRDTIDCVRGEFIASLEQYKLLQTRGINQADVKKYVSTLFGQEDVPPEEVSTRTSNLMQEVVQRLEREQKTLWGLYNAYNGWLNHSYGRSDEKRLEGIWFGMSAQKDQKAMDLALSMVG